MTISSDSARLVADLPDASIGLMQIKVGSQENEFAAAPRLLKTINLQGKIVTGDALLARREWSEPIVAAAGDYDWMVKEHQPSLRAEIESQ